MTKKQHKVISGIKGHHKLHENEVTGGRNLCKNSRENKKPLKIHFRKRLYFECGFQHESLDLEKALR